MTEEEKTPTNEAEAQPREEAPKAEAEEAPRDDYVELIAQAKAEAEADKAKLRAEYEKRLAERDSIIRNLITGKQEAKNEGHFYDGINAKREAQRKKW